MQTIELSHFIDKNVETVYKAVCDAESYPQYINSIISVRVLERSARTAVTAWTIEVDGIRLTWQERDEYSPENFTVRFQMAQGDMAHYEGEWSVQPAPGGAILGMKVSFDLGLPIISGMLQYLLTKKVESTCREIINGIQEIAGKETISLSDSVT